ncbi:MAG: hypothetical protein Q9196_005552 [Gyalolechia fulgens]
MARKAELGKHVLSRLIKAFLDRRRRPRDRRWTGSLALELLRDCGRNRDIIAAPESGALRYQLGASVIDDDHESLRLIAGTIIREMVENGLSANEFWEPEKYPEPPSIFEAVLEHASQWTTDFVAFVDDLETQGIVSEQRNSSTFAYAVYFGGNVYNTRVGLSILVTLKDDLTIVVPSTQSDTAKYIDIPQEHIAAVHLAQGQQGSQPGKVPSPPPIVLVILLEAMTDAAYFVNEVKHQPSQIVLAFDALEDATFIRQQIEAIIVPRENDGAGGTTGLGTTNFILEDLGQPAEMLTQSACLDISSHQNQEGSVTHQNAGRLRSLQVINQSSPASESTSHLTEPANNEPKQETHYRQQRKDVDHSVDKSAGNVLVATEVLDVSQDLRHDEIHDRGRSHPKDDSDAEPTSTRAWRDGMQAIENARELESTGPSPAPRIGTKTCTVDESHVVQHSDEDLYSASPPRQNMQSAQAKTGESHGNTEERQPQSIASLEPSETTMRKLSRSMRVGENEKSSAPPPPSTEKGGSAAKGRGIGKTPPSLIPEPSTQHKRKSKALGDTGPSKKRRTKNVVSEKSATGKPANSSVKKPAASDDYDIPPSPKHAQPKIRKSASNKPRFGEGRAKDQMPSTTSKSADAKSPPVNGAAEMKSPNVGKTAKRKQASILAETDWDQDLVVDADSDDGSHLDEKFVKLSKNRSKKATMKAVSKGQMRKKIQTTKSNTKKKASEVKDGVVPTRSPRKPRAAAEKAKRKILAIDDGDGEEEDVSSQQEHSNEIEMATDAPRAPAPDNSERLSGDVDGVTGAFTADTSGKKQRTLNAKDSIGSDVKARVDGDQHMSSGKTDAAESLISNAQPAMEHLASHLNGQVPISERASNPSSIITGDQASAQQVAPSNPDPVIAPPQSLDSNKHRSIVSNPSFMDTETCDIGSKAPSPSLSGNAGQRPEVEDTHFHDAMAPLLLDAAELFVDDRHAPVEHDFDIGRGPNNGVDLTHAAREKVVDGLALDAETLREGGLPSEKASMTDVSDGQEETTAKCPHTPENVPQEEDMMPFELHPPHMQERAVAPSSANHGQDVKRKLSQTYTREPSDGPKVSSNRTSPAHINENANNSFPHSTQNIGIQPHGPLNPVSQVLHTDLDQRLETTEPVIGVGEILETPPQFRNGGIVIEDDECGPSQPETNAATETRRPIPQCPEISLNGLPVEEKKSDSDMPIVPIRSVCPTSNVPGFGIDTTDRPLVLPDASQPRPHQSAPRPTCEELNIKKRPAETIDQTPHKKRRLLSQAHQTRRPNTPFTKDPSRIPQVISFSAKGSRNQGTFSPAYSLKAQLAAQNQRVKNGTPDETPLQQKDMGTITVEESNGASSAHAQIHRGAKRSRIELQDDDLNVQGEFLTPEPASSSGRRSRDQTTSPLEEHDSLFVGDRAPKLSSQSSRVTEKGSPMPAQRTIITKIVMKEPADLQIAPPGSEVVGTPFGEGEATFVHQQDDESPELELPDFVAPGNARKKQAGFIGSSNSKHRPSSPGAPSAMLTEVEAHMAEPSGQFVNMQTDEVLIPSNLQDPFANKRGQRPTTFMEKLRHASSVGHKEDRATKHSKSTEQHRGTGFATTEEDRDETPVEVPRRQSRRRGQTTSTMASTDSTSQSNQQSQTTEGSNASDAIYERWRGALEPHQENMLTVLCEISHNLFGHLIDAESAINDVVKDYQHRGERVIKNLADDLERELAQYIETVGARHGKTMKELESLNSHVTKNLQRKPKAEALAVQMEERRKVMDEQMEAAFSLCGEGVD